MALPSDFDLWELRYIDNGSTFPTAFVAADNSAWNPGTATKLRVHDLDVSDLHLASVPDASVQERFHGRPAPIKTLSGGVETQSIKFKMYLPGGSASQTAETVAALLGQVMGGIASPATAISDLAEALSTVTNIVAASHGQTAGQGVLVGTLGDGKGGGRFGVVKTANANDYDLMMALPGIPAASDAVKHGHTLYVDDTDESYQSFLAIGSYAGSGASDYPVLLNIIGCSGIVGFGGLAAGEAPFAEFAFQVGDWRVEPYATTEAFSYTSTYQGDDPAGDRGIGTLAVGDNSATTRSTVQGGDVEVDLGMELVPIIDPEGINGIAGWKKVRSDAGPTMSLTAYWGDEPGRRNDFTGGTSKQIQYVLGHASEATVAFEMQSAHLVQDPATPMEYNRMLGQRLIYEGDSGRATDLSTDALILQDASIRIHLL